MFKKGLYETSLASTTAKLYPFQKAMKVQLPTQFKYLKANKSNDIGSYYKYVITLSVSFTKQNTKIRSKL